MRPRREMCRCESNRKYNKLCIPFLPYILSLVFSDQSSVVDLLGPLTVSLIFHIMFTLTYPDSFPNAHRVSDLPKSNKEKLRMSQKKAFRVEGFHVNLNSKKNLQCTYCILL